jgi:hypothetical protein
LEAESTEAETISSETSLRAASHKDKTTKILYDILTSTVDTKAKKQLNANSKIIKKIIAVSSLDQLNQARHNPLCAAIIAQNVDAVTWLLEAGANPNISDHEVRHL